jgi:inhibitor of cysteine peptidase
MNKKFLLLGLAAILMIILLTSCCASIIPDLGLATVEKIDILTLESFPVQVFIIASGYLPNPCTEIYQITQEREGNTFFITIETYCSQEVCIQVIAPFEEVIPLDEVYGLPAGTYTVEVNGVQGTFGLEIDNILSL